MSDENEQKAKPAVDPILQAIDQFRADVIKGIEEDGKPLGQGRRHAIACTLICHNATGQFNVGGVLTGTVHSGAMSPERTEALLVIADLLSAAGSLAARYDTGHVGFHIAAALSAHPFVAAIGEPSQLGRRVDELVDIKAGAEAGAPKKPHVH